LKNIIKKALTRTIAVKGPRGKVRDIEVPPSQKLVLGIYFAIAALISLTILEATYILVLRSFNSEIFAAITGLIGTISGILIAQKT